MRLRGVQLDCHRPFFRPEGSCTRQVSIAIEPGTFTLVCGPEGCGKNLLLRLLGLMDTPDGGEVWLGDMATTTLTAAQRAALRSRHFGFVFSDAFLLPSFSVAENIAMPYLRIFAVKAEEASERTSRLLETAGLPDFGDADVECLRPSEKRRVALLRALVNEPDFLLIEDIDQHLDASEYDGFFETLRLVAAGRTIVATATDPRFAHCADRILAMEDGCVVADTQSVAG